MNNQTLKQAYKNHVITVSSFDANAIHNFRQQNRKEDGTRYSYKEVGQALRKMVHQAAEVIEN